MKANESIRGIEGSRRRESSKRRKKVKKKSGEVIPPVVDVTNRTPTVDIRLSINLKVGPLIKRWQIKRVRSRIPVNCNEYLDSNSLVTQKKVVQVAASRIMV